MKILLTFVGRTKSVLDSTRLLAELFRRKGHSVDSQDLLRKEIDVLAPYDAVIIGGAMWFGKLDTELVSYLSKNEQELLLKPVYIFVHSYLSAEKFQKQISKQIEPKILEHARTFNLGLNVEFSALGFLDKLKWLATMQRAEFTENDETLEDLVTVVTEKVIQMEEID